MYYSVKDMILHAWKRKQSGNAARKAKKKTRRKGSDSSRFNYVSSENMYVAIVAWRTASVVDVTLVEVE